MNNNKIALYKGNRQANLVKSNDSNCQTNIVPSDRDSEVDYLSRLTPEQLLECKRIYNQALVYSGDYARHNKDLSLRDEDRVKIAAATKAEEKQRTEYLKQDGVLQARFGNESHGKRTKSKKKSAKEEQQIATDNLIHDLKIQKQVVKDCLTDRRLGEPEREIIKDILDEEATEYSTFEDIKPILKTYLIYLNQKIESLDQVSRDNDYRKHIHKKQAYKRDYKRDYENVQALILAIGGKIPTLETIAKDIIERGNDTKALELLALNQYEGNIDELIEVLVISRSNTLMGEDHDNIQMMLVPIDVEDIEAFIAEQNTDLVPYLHPAYEETDNRYALTAFSPVNNLPVDISRDENYILSTDGFNGKRCINPNNQLLLEQAQSNVAKAKLLSAASDMKLLPAAEDAEGNNDDDSDNSLAIVLADKEEKSALDIIPTSVSILDALETNEEVISLTLTNPVGVLNAIIIEENIEKRNKNEYIVKSSGEEVFHSSCKNLASEVIKKTEKIKPLFFGQLVEGDSSYYDRVNDVTRVYITNTGETVTYEGLVKLGKFASDESIFIDEAKVLEATIKNAANIAEVTQYDGSSLQSLKNEYQLTVATAQDIIRTYWNIEQNNQTWANNTVLSEEEYEAYCQSKNYGKESNIICESDLLSVSESNIKSLKDFLKYIDDTESAKSIAIRELETLLSAISEEQAQINNTPPEEIPDLIEAMTLESNEVEDIVNRILQEHFQCDMDKAREILTLYPAVETVLDIGTKEDKLGNETFNLPADIWTNEDYRYEEWNGQRDLLPFPSEQEYQKFVGFIRNIKGNDGNIVWDSLLLTIDLKRTLDLLNSQDLDAANELKTQIDEEARTKVRRKIEELEDSEEVLIEELSSSTEELFDNDIQINKDIESNSEAELEDLGFVDPKINVAQEDIQILERILQKKINSQKMAMKDRMVWAKYFESISYESVEAETISRKIEQMKALLF